MPKLLGQHFLKNPALIDKIIAAIDPQAGETIFEIGPGHGELTLPLAKICKKIGARLVAIEKDKKLAENLESQIERLDLKDCVEIFSQDALEFLKGESTAYIAPPQPYKIVGNIPYYITGHLLRIVSEMTEKPARCVFMIQKEVAQRICAAPPRMNRLAASVQYWATPKIIAQVPKESFSPPPEVDSAVITLITTPNNLDKDSARYYAAVRTLFAQPRKTILNNLVQERESKEKIATALQSIGIDPKLRPQNLNVENILKIKERFF